MAKKVKLQVTHPSFDGHKKGDIISVDKDDITERMELFTTPYVIPKEIGDSFKKEDAALDKKLAELEAKEAELVLREEAVAAKEAELEAADKK